MISMDFKYKINEKVKTGYGIGIVIDAKYEMSYDFRVYFIKYEDGNEYWAFEDSLEKVEDK